MSVLDAIEKLAAKEFAPGIPKKEHVPPPPKVKKPEFWDFSVQEHKARRAGKHYDIRLIDPKDRAHSFAVRSLPKPGETARAPQQPLHTGEYARTFEGVIERGYGAGKVRIVRKGPAEVIESGADKVTVHLHDRGKSPEEWTFVRTGNTPKDWLLVNHTKTPKNFPIPHSKPKYRTAEIAKVPAGDPESVLQPKIDGAHGLVFLESGKKPRIFSYRKPAGGGLIEWTHKFEDLLTRRMPKGFGKTVLRGEVYIEDKKGKAAPERVTAGVLNSAAIRAREKQKDVGQLRIAPFMVEKLRGRPFTDKPYAEHMRAIEEISRKVDFLKPVPTARTQREKERLLEAIRRKKHKLSSEGVVLWPLAGGRPTKAKIRPDYDVFVRNVFRGTGKYENAAGGFTYSNTPKGPIIGRVGTGLSDALRKKLWESPEGFKGRVARISAQEQFPSGALRAPAFLDWHWEKGIGREKRAFSLQDAMKVLRLAKAKQLPKASQRLVYGLGLPPSLLSATPRRFGAATRAHHRLLGSASPGIRELRHQIREDPLTRLGLKAGPVIIPTKSGGDTKRLFRKVLEPSGDTKRWLQKTLGVDAEAGRLPLTPSENRMLEGVLKGHELDELGARPSASFLPFGHRSPDVILREHNRVVTLPSAYGGVRRIMDLVRNFAGAEAGVLRRATGGKFDYGSSPRLSRHARRRIVALVERLGG